MDSPFLERIRQIDADAGKWLKERLASGQTLTFDDLAWLARRLGVEGKSGESAQWIREDRD
jgi:hypothetical protein